MKPNVELFHHNSEFQKFCASSPPVPLYETDFYVRTLRNTSSPGACAMQIASIVEEGKIRTAASPFWMQLFKRFWNSKVQEAIKDIGGEWVIVRIVDSTESRKTNRTRGALWDQTHANLDAKLYAAGITAALGGLGLTLRREGEQWFYQPHSVLYMLKNEVIGGGNVLRRHFVANKFVGRPVTVMATSARLGPQSRTIDAVFYANRFDLSARRSVSRNAWGANADIASAIFRSGATAQVYTHNFRLKVAEDGAIDLRRVFRLPD